MNRCCQRFGEPRRVWGVGGWGLVRVVEAEPGRRYLVETKPDFGGVWRMITVLKPGPTPGEPWTGFNLLTDAERRAAVAGLTALTDAWRPAGLPGRARWS